MDGKKVIEAVKVIKEIEAEMKGIELFNKKTFPQLQEAINKYERDNQQIKLVDERIDARLTAFEERMERMLTRNALNNQRNYTPRESLEPQEELPSVNHQTGKKIQFKKEIPIVQELDEQFGVEDPTEEEVTWTSKVINSDITEHKCSNRHIITVIKDNKGQFAARIDSGPSKPVTDETLLIMKRQVAELEPI